jgi:MFS family permease
MKRMDLEGVGRRQWQALWAAFLGWALDGMDILLYAFALGTLRAEFGLSAAAAGSLASATLIASAIGGIAFGILADRYGRVRMLVISILTYSVFTALTATARTVPELVLWRTLVGLGLGGEWATGSVLVAETWPARHRGKAIGFVQSGWAVGYILAAVCAALILPRWGWRALFLAGILPAFLTLWIRRTVPEPEIWRTQVDTARAGVRATVGLVLRAPYARRLAIASVTTACVLFAYWGLFTWVPTFLATAVDAGGAGLGVVRSAAWIVPMQIGAFLGYLSFGFAADRIGRRPAFIAFLLAAAVVVPIYALGARHERTLLILGPVVGFFGHGYFSVFGSLLSELFPTRVRGMAQGFAYNSGRATSALAPLAIGAVADRAGFAVALACTSAFFLLGAVASLGLPETRGAALDVEGNT